MNLQDLHDIVFETWLLYLKHLALSEGITVGLIASWATPKNLRCYYKAMNDSVLVCFDRSTLAHSVKRSRLLYLIFEPRQKHA